MEAFSCGSSAAHRRDKSDTAIPPWWMSCDRHWKLLLGGFRSLVQGLYISKVKSKLCARPILSLTPSFCCENIVSFVLPLKPQHTQTLTHTLTCLHPPPAPFPSCVKWTIPTKSQSVSIRPMSCSVAKYGNVAFPHSHGSAPDKAATQNNTRRPTASAYKLLCVLSSDSSARRRSWASDRFVRATVCVCVHVCECVRACVCVYRGMKEDVKHTQLMGNLNGFMSFQHESIHHLWCFTVAADAREPYQSYCKAQSAAVYSSHTARKSLTHLLC